MSLNPTGSARWRDLYRSRGELPLDRSRFRASALLRLAVVMPFAVGPTQWFMRQALDKAHAPEEAVLAVQLHLGAAVVYVLANIWLFFITGPEAPSRPRLLAGLTAVSVGCEILTNEAFLWGFGTMANYSVGFLVLIIVIYRVLFDYRTGLLTLAATLVAFTGFALLELSGAMPVAPLAPRETLASAWHDPVMSRLVLSSVPLVGVLSFMISNYSVNQTVRLHRYITHGVLHRYLPPALVDKAASGKLQFDAPPERREITVMFTDVVGFTPLTERLGPTAIGGLLDGYLGTIADIAHRHGATVDKFIGDCVMILFGAPEPMEPAEQARRCVELAAEIHAAVDAMDVDSPLQARTGINTGEAVIGNFGSHARSDYTALGPAVNVAARLEGASFPGRVLVGSRTAELLGDSVALDPAGALELKGVSAPVEAWLVRSITSSETS